MSLFIYLLVLRKGCSVRCTEISVEVVVCRGIGVNRIMSRVVGARTGVTLNLNQVKKDVAGFDNLDDFWGAKGAL